MDKNKIVTINFSDIRNSVKHHSNTESYYNEWDYLNTNILMPDFKAFMQRLQSLKEKDTTKKLLKEFEKPLFDILEQWAFRVKDDDKYGIAAAHDVMKASANTQEAKTIFIQKCSKIFDNLGGLSWDHNQPEVLVGQALLGLIEHKDPELIYAELNDSISEYENVSMRQVRNDIDRAGRFAFDINGKVGYMNEESNPQSNSYQHFRLENFPELTGEQIGFIKNLHGQGKLDGGWFVPIAKTAIKNGVNIINANDPGDSIPSNCFIMHDREKTYLISSRKLSGINSEEALSTLGTVTTIIDSSGLKGDKFTIGCASTEVEVKMIVEAPDTVIEKLQLPAKSGISQKHNAILKNASEAIATAKSWDDLIQEEKTRKNAVDALSEYMGQKLGEGVIVNKDLKNQMKEDVIRLLKPFATDEKKIKALNDTAGSIVRKCVEIASEKDSSISLSFGQKIRKVITDNLKNFFSRDPFKKEFHNILNDEFIHNLKAGMSINSANNTNNISSQIKKHNSTRGV